MARKTYTQEERDAKAAARRTLDARVRACADDPDAAAALLEAHGGVVRLSDPATGYSGNNPLRLIIQADEAGIVGIDDDGNERPLIFAGFHTWRTHGRSVMKGQRGLWIYSGGGVSEDDDGDGESRRYIGTTFVWELSQTQPMTDEEIARHKERRDEATEEVA